MVSNCQLTASVIFRHPMPELDRLMAEWPAEVEVLIKQLHLPNGDHMALEEFIDAICGVLDIPTYRLRIQF